MSAAFFSVIFFCGKFAIDCQRKNWLTSCSCSSIFLRYFRRQVAAKIHFVWHGEFLLKSLQLQQNFVTVISHMNSNWFESGQLITATKCEIVVSDTSPHKVLPRVSGLLFYLNGNNSYSKISFYWYSALLLITERVINLFPLCFQQVKTMIINWKAKLN